MRVTPAIKRTEPLKFVDKARTSQQTADRQATGDATADREIPAPPDLVRQFIDLEAVARSATDLGALKFAMVNAWRRLLPYDQALLAEPSALGGWSVTLASGVLAVDRNAPLVGAASAWINHPRPSTGTLSSAQVVNIEKDLGQWFPNDDSIAFPHAIWLPLRARDGHLLAGILLLRQAPWEPHEQALLMPLADVYAYSWWALSQTSAGRRQELPRIGRRELVLVLCGLFGLAALVPVPLSTLSPAEVVAVDTEYVTSPIDGVLADILQPPGAWVRSGDLIARFVDVKARNDAEIAQRNVMVAAARHFRIVQSATTSMKDTAELATTKAEWEIAKAELSYANDVLARTELRASRDGLLIYSGKSDWLGKPLSTGERIMEIGDPAQTEVRVDLPVSDAIVLQPGNHLRMFLDGDPLTAIDGRITRVSYRPALTPDQQLVHRVFGTLEKTADVKIGLRGTAKLSGNRVPLAFYLFRRPVAAVRQRIGL